MDDNTYTSTPSSPKSSSPWPMIALVVAIIVVVGLVLLWFTNRSKIDQLANQLSKTQEEVQEVQQESQSAEEGVREAVAEGAQNVVDAIAGIENPTVRLAVAKAYAAKLAAVLDEAGKRDLNVVMLYIEKDPTVLVKKPTQYPADVTTAINNLKTKLASVRQSVATSVQDAQAKVQAKVNDLTTLTGTLAFVEDDPVLGGSLFVLTETGTGKKYYFQFNAQNSATVKSQYLGKEVDIKVKVTGIQNGNVTYDVVSGPTLASPKPSAATTSGSTR